MLADGDLKQVGNGDDGQHSQRAKWIGIPIKTKRVGIDVESRRGRAGSPAQFSVRRWQFSG
jgi:hypothetical protein